MGRAKDKAVGLRRIEVHVQSRGIDWRHLESRRLRWTVFVDHLDLVFAGGPELEEAIQFPVLAIQRDPPPAARLRVFPPSLTRSGEDHVLDLLLGGDPEHADAAVG